MAFEQLKSVITQQIKTNGQESITGAVMQAILLEMVNQLGAEGSYLPLTGGNVTGGIVVSSDLSSPSHEALRLNPSGISVEKIASVGLNEILNVTANSITYSSYFPSEAPNTLTISLGYTGVTLSGGVTAASFINSSVDASIRYQYLLKADGNVISISDIGGTDMQTVWEALAASTNEQINVSHLSTALNGYIHPTLSNLSNGDILVYDSVGTWVNTSMSSFLSGYATETWVNTQLASYATQSWVTSQGYITSSALNGYATQSWVTSQGYIQPTLSNLSNGDVLIYDSVGAWYNTPLSSFFNGYATQSWVGQQGYITSAALAGYLPLTGGTLTGTLNMLPDVVQINFRPDHSGYNSKIEYITYGNEALVWANKNAVTSFIFKCGLDLLNANMWTNITPSLQIKNQSVYINSLIATGVEPSYNLYVNGSANATTLYENGSRVITTANIGNQSVNYATTSGTARGIGISANSGDILICDGGAAWVTIPSSYISDIRKKDVINYNAEPTFEAVANAPAIRFTYKDARYSFNQGIHVGSIAQYWQTTLPETVTMDNDGMLSMKYDVIALLSTISVAKKVSEHERRIILLERENEQLKKEIEALKSA